MKVGGSTPAEDQLFSHVMMRYIIDHDNSSLEIFRNISWYNLFTSSLMAKFTTFASEMHTRTVKYPQK